MNRPEVRNAIGAGLIAELTQTFAALGDDDSRVLVLTGAGGAFSAGADVEWMRAAVISARSRTSPTPTPPPRCSPASTHVPSR